ncbi:MAG: molybdopterin cofactor-binding domain-containing protein [Bryobacteraceae bacterium]
MRIEPERYELFEAPAYTFTLDRREFLGVAGVLVTLTFTGEAHAQTTPAGARIHVGDNGIVTVLTGKVEVGQGARTEVAMAVAEEMGVALDNVRVVMADTSLAPNDGITAGSRTTPSTIPAVRKAAAAARGVLPAGSVKPVKDWTVLGKPHHRIDAREIVTGAHQYPSDIRRPGMLYGSVLRAPAYAATLASADIEAGRKIEGAVVVRDGDFIGCAAPTSHAARQAVDAIAKTAQWKTAAHPASKDLFEYLKAHRSTSRQPREQTRGSVEPALAEPAKKLSGVYRVPYIQHAPMEPRAAVAEWSDGSVTVWTGTQNPFGVRDQLAQAFRIPASRVRVIVPDSGGGFGGKHTGEVAIEAARIAKEAGKPVCLRWTRQEEFTWAYFRPAGLFEIEASLDAGGRIAAWDFTNYNAGTAGIATPYATPNVRTRFVYCDSPLREGSYRGIAATANNFARECFIDELAAAAGADPLEFRLANLDDARMRGVLEAAAREFGWERRAKTAGIACGTEKGSYVAACAAVRAEGGRVHVDELVMAFECGAILNPANLRAQIEGSIIQGMGGALSEEMLFENGKLLNGKFAQYRVPRFRDVPAKMRVIMVNRPDLASAGAGETPIIAVAPAIANALFAATGARRRALPLRA